jgi:chromosome segregation ATPase
LQEKKSEIASLKENLAKANEVKRQAATKIKEQENSIEELRTDLEVAERNIVSKVEENQKLLETLNHLHGNCFNLSWWCCDTMKKIFSKVSATSRASSFANGDTEGALGWVEKELSGVENIINARSSYCAIIESRCMASVL